MTDENNNLALFADDRFEPCRVCGEPSSGWHCGAVTCEACKKFFLRSINGEDAKYKCLRNQDCVIVRTTRTQCQYCRFQKCKEVGMTINENPSNPTVAELFKGFACSVCKAPSSGVHFGAITCEGCKGFFRRSIKERAPERYRCMETGDCEISVATRNMCRHCRFQRCLKSGMSASNSRIGRQSNLFKHHIIEWQSRGLTPNSGYLINQRSKVKRNKSDTTPGFIINNTTTTSTTTNSNNHNISSNNNNNNNNSSSMTINSIVTASLNPTTGYEQINGMNQMQPIQNINCINNINTSNMNINIINNQQIIQNHHYNNNNDFITINSNDLYSNTNLIDPNNYGMNSNYNNGSIIANVNNNNTYYSWNPTMPNSNINMNNNGNNNNQMIVNHVKHQQIQHHHHHTAGSGFCIEDSLNENVKNLIKVIHQAYTQYLSSIVENMTTEFAKNATFNNSLNYNHHHHSNNHHQHQQNGSFIEMMKYLNFYMRKVCSFSHNIPGLNDITQDDKDELVRCSIHSVVFLSIQRKCNYFNYFNCDPAKFEKFKMLINHPKFHYHAQFMKTIHDKFEKVKLDDKEYGLYTALLVVSAASPDLKEYEKINQVREDIGTALRQYMNLRRNEEITCDDIVLMLVQFKRSRDLLRESMVTFHKQMSETNMEIFKEHQYFYRAFMPNKANSL